MYAKSIGITDPVTDPVKNQMSKNRHHDGCDGFLRNFTLFAAFSPNVTMTVVYFDDGCLFHVKFHGIPRGRFVDISWTFVKPNSGLIRVFRVWGKCPPRERSAEFRGIPRGRFVETCSRVLQVKMPNLPQN